MLRLAADENFNGKVYDALLRAQPDLDIVRAQDAGLTGTDDRALLAWAAAEGRVLLTSDRQTLISFAYERVRSGAPMPGVIVVRTQAQIGPSVDDILVVVGASQPDEWEGQVIYLPL